MELRCLLTAILGIVSLPFALAQAPTSAPKGSASGELRFLQGNFAKFTPASFLPPTNKTDTAIQSFKVSEHILGDYLGVRYTGIRFTLPDWLDGDLKCSFFHLNPETQRRQHVEMGWGIIPEHGDSFPQRIRRIDPDDTQAFWKRFPFTRRVYAQTVARTNLQAGQNYALYLAHFAPVVPDVAFALTIDSERGRKEFGSLAFISGPTGIPSLLQVSPRTAFLQKNWTNFPMITFLPPTNKTETAFQVFKANDHVIGEFEGRYYTGVRFTLPQWMDGDFAFAFVQMYRSDRELRQRTGFSWGLTPEHGDDPPMEQTDRVFFVDLPETQGRFPYTEKGYTGSVKLAFLRPGQAYIFCWGHTKPVVSDVALALAVISERGRKEFGEISWR